MGLFDDVKQDVCSIGGGVRKPDREYTEEVVFSVLPDTLEQFKNLPQAVLNTPFDTAALTVIALCFYPKDRELSLAMLEYLKGPGCLSEHEKQFLRDRFIDKDYVPRSYFKGATPQNDYTPSKPYTICVSENPYSYDNQGYGKLFIISGGADSPRPIQVRQAKDGKWYLWEQFLLADIRKPESSNPWA